MWNTKHETQNPFLRIGQRLITVGQKEVELSLEISYFVPVKYNRGNLIHKVGNHIRFILFILFIFFQMSGMLSAQTLLTHHYTESTGLISSYVNDVAQDKNGDMWFATRIGLSRYDGLDWASFYSTKGLRNMSIEKLRIDQDGGVWSVAMSPFLYVSFFSDEKWNDFHPLDTAFKIKGIKSFEVLIDGHDTLCFVGTNERSLYYFDGNKWNVSPKSEVGANIFAIENTSKGILIASEKGIFKYGTNGFSTYPFHSTNSKLLGLTVEQPGSSNEKIWLIDKKSISFFSKDSLHHVTDLTLELNKPLVAEPDYLGGLYFANNLMTWHYDHTKSEISTIGIKNGAISDGACSLYTDKEKNLWQCSTRGVCKIPINLFTNYNSNNGLLSNEVSAIDEYLPGKFVFGHNTGLSFWDGKVTSTIEFETTYTLRNLTRILDIAHDIDGTIYLAGSQLGFGVIEKEGEISWVDSTRNGDDQTTSVVIDSAGTIWVSGFSRIYTYADKTLVPHVLTKKFRNITIRKLFLNRNGELMIGTFRSGLFKYDKDGITQYLAHNNPKANCIYSFYEDENGEALIGTLDGLYTIQNDSLVKYNLIEDLNDRPVFLIIKKDGILWFGSDNGLYCWNGHKSLFHTVKNGFSGVEVNRSAGIVDSQGNLWFGSDRGLSKLNQEYLFQDAILSPKPVKIESIQANLINLSTTNGNRISHRNNNLSFTFSSKSYINENAIRYLVKLEGFDNDWSKELLPVYNTKSYTNLPSGKYRFWVKSKNAFGIWGEAQASPIIQIDKPFYRTWWFLLLIATGLLLIARWLYYYYSSRIWTLRLEEMVKEKTEKLEASEKRYQQMVENSNAVMLMADSLELKIIQCNQAALNFTGYPQQALTGLKLAKLFTDGKSIEIINNLHDQKQGNFTGNVELKNHTTRNVEVFFSRIGLYDSDAYFLIIHDITDRVEFEGQLKESNETKDKFLSIISHDLKSPFSSLLGFSELLLDEYEQMTDKERIANLKTINEVSENTYHLLDNLLQWAMSQSGKIEYLPRKLNLEDIIDYNLQVAYMAIESKKIRIESDVLADIHIFADENMLNSIIRNLLSNAIKFTPENGKISMQASESDTETLFSISDTGMGLSPENLKSILSKENNLSTRGTKNEKGTGLGLNLCRDFIDRHQGRFWVESEPGKGSRFSFSLPSR